MINKKKIRGDDDELKGDEYHEERMMNYNNVVMKEKYEGNAIVTNCT